MICSQGFGIFIMWIGFLLDYALSGDVYYEASFCEDVVPCTSFHNSFIKCEDLKVGKEDGNSHVGLTGFIDLISKITEDYELNLKISKILNIGKEVMWNARANVCSSLKQKDTPWDSLVEMMNLTSCPINVNNYKISDLNVNLDFAKGVLCHEFCGEYEVEISLWNNLVQVSCYNMMVDIEEKTSD